MTQTVAIRAAASRAWHGAVASVGSGKTRLRDEAKGRVRLHWDGESSGVQRRQDGPRVRLARVGGDERRRRDDVARIGVVFAGGQEQRATQ
jgi:hypothetical protein